MLSREAFDLMLVDIHMPELDGLEVVRRVRHVERSARSSGSSACDRPDGHVEARRPRPFLEAGMDDYLNKPLMAAELWSAINRVTTDQPQGASDSPSLLSPSVLLAACGDDAEMLRTMCRSFSVRAPEHLARLERAMRDRDAATLREAAASSTAWSLRFRRQPETWRRLSRISLPDRAWTRPAASWSGCAPSSPHSSDSVKA